MAFNQASYMKKYRARPGFKAYNNKKGRESYARNKEKRNKENRERYRELKQKVYLKLGNRCANPACQWLNGDGSRGCVDIRCLQIDHINSDGHKERKIWKATTFLTMVLKDVENRYQLLCANCNWIKRMEQGEYTKRER